MSDIVSRLRFDFRDRDADEVEELLQEIASLTAHDPLAEMWRVVESHQHRANECGYGEYWAKLCQDRNITEARNVWGKVIRSNCPNTECADICNAVDYAKMAIAALRDLNESLDRMNKNAREAIEHINKSKDQK